jgi:hypothetical protein
MRFLGPKTRSGIAVLCAALALGTGAALTAQSAAVPTAREVIDRHIAAIGGEAAFKAVRSIRVRGKFEITGANLNGEFEMVAARPSKMKLNVTLPSFGPMERGYDGTVAWTVDSQLGPRLLKDRELRELALDADFDAPLHPAASIKEATTVDRTQFDGHPAYKLRIVFTSGVEQTEYFDADTGLQLGFEAERALAPGMAVPTTGISRDYKKFGSLMFATTLIEKALATEQVLHINSIEFDAVPDSAFAIPPQIKALIK